MQMMLRLCKTRSVVYRRIRTAKRFAAAACFLKQLNVFVARHRDCDREFVNLKFDAFHIRENRTLGSSRQEFCK